MLSLMDLLVKMKYFQTDAIEKTEKMETSEIRKVCIFKLKNLKLVNY